MSREQTISDLCKPLVESMGYEWVGVEFHANSVNSILRIYVDKPEGGISMEDVVAVTEQINPLLDVKDPISVAYTLEVSSPGLDRPLFTPEHFQRFTGELVKLNVRQPVERRRKFTGVIQSVDLEENKLILSLEKEGEMVELALDNIDKARLVPVFDN
ncbi:ribosome maturation factor RimP [Rappaport israeli]|uniref:ribosome maturation factor RimP n=1 Tax=Rappaport israeli TaxID=1839807 RepID=UPI0009302AEF|nr:ribosome maturation factor RimP [Rappaport israeli]